MRNFRPTQVACALVLALAAGTASAQFSGTYIFGDSLSDAGQYGARFTTNPGLTAAMYVGQAYGLTSSPSFQGGNDFAQGGARVNSPSPLVPPGVPDNSIAQQVNQFLAKGLPDRNALYQIQGGANDIFVLANQFLGGQITQPQLQAAVAQAAVDLATQAAKLKAAGAQYVVVQALPDIGKTPMAAAAGAQATFTALSDLFNTTLNAAVGNGGLQVMQFNTSKLLNEIIASPALYGFTNATSVACTTSSSLQCTPATLVSSNANLTYVFADGVHPTTGANLVLSQAIVSMMTGPQQMAALGQAPFDVERANWRTLDGRMMSAIGAPGAPGKFNAWAAYDYASPDVFGNGLSGSGDMSTISVGGDMRLSDKMLAGLQFSYTDYKGDFGNGDFKLREPMFTAYMGYGEGPWYLGATLGAGGLDFSTTRNIQLGAAMRTESGDTRGWHAVGRLLGGYWFRYGDWNHGPFAKLTYEKLVVREFSENGSDSTSLTYGQQNNDAFWSSLGWQVAGNVSGFRPFARVTWEYNFQNDDRVVQAHANNLNGWYTMPAFAQDSNWALFDVGVSRDFGGVTGFIGANASAGKGDGDYWSVTVGIRAPL
ncbi:MAG: autotransporter domain-containing protein [Burkholderiales bacterium]